MKNATMNDSHLLDDVLAFDNMGRTVYGAEYLDRLASAFATLDIDATKWCTHYIINIVPGPAINAMLAPTLYYEKSRVSSQSFRNVSDRLKT